MGLERLGVFMETPSLVVPGNQGLTGNCLLEYWFLSNSRFVKLSVLIKNLKFLNSKDVSFVYKLSSTLIMNSSQGAKLGLT